MSAARSLRNRRTHARSLVLAATLCPAARRCLAEAMHAWSLGDAAANPEALAAAALPGRLPPDEPPPCCRSCVAGQHGAGRLRRAAGAAAAESKPEHGHARQRNGRAQADRPASDRPASDHPASVHPARMHARARRLRRTLRSGRGWPALLTASLRNVHVVHGSEPARLAWDLRRRNLRFLRAEPEISLRRPAHARERAEEISAPYIRSGTGIPSRSRPLSSTFSVSAASARREFMTSSLPAFRTGHCS